VCSKEIGLEVHGDKTKYMVMSRNRNAVKIHSMEFGNNYFEWVGAFKYLGTNLTDQNSIVEQIKSILKPGIACCHLSSSLLSTILNINVYRTIIVSVVLYGCETWSLTLREERSLRVSENRMLRTKFGPTWDEVTG